MASSEGGDGEADLGDFQDWRATSTKSRWLAFTMEKVSRCTRCTSVTRRRRRRRVVW